MTHLITYNLQHRLHKCGWTASGDGLSEDVRSCTWVPVSVQVCAIVFKAKATYIEKPIFGI